MASKRRTRTPKSEAERIAETTVPYVLAESTRIAIEKMATDVAQKILADETYQAELRAMVKRVSAEAAQRRRGTEPAAQP